MGEGELRTVFRRRKMVDRSVFSGINTIDKSKIDEFADNLRNGGRRTTPMVRNLRHGRVRIIVDIGENMGFDHR